VLLENIFLIIDGSRRSMQQQKVNTPAQPLIIRLKGKVIQSTTPMQRDARSDCKASLIFGS
jgi:hypothetical protein